jgi:hypothetical protein
MKILQHLLSERVQILLSIFLAILLLLNTVISHAFTPMVDDTGADQVLGVRSFFFECYTLSVLPVKLIEEFYGSSSPAKEAKKDRPPEQEQNTTAAGASLLSITIAAEGNRAILGERTGSCFGTSAFCLRVPLVHLASLPHRPPGGIPDAGAPAIPLFLLLLLLLSRRIVEEDAYNGITLPERKDRHTYVPVFFSVI